MKTKHNFLQLITLFLLISCKQSHVIDSENIVEPPAIGNFYYASPDGNTSGNGTIENPWDLQTALNSNNVIQPGDTLYLLEGTYYGKFFCNLTGTQGSLITIKPYNGAFVTIDGNKNPVVGSYSHPAQISMDGDYCQIMDLFITNSVGKHVATTPDSFPTDIHADTGVSFRGKGNKVINCIIYNNPGTGIGGMTDVGTEAYGNIVFNNGWDGPDKGHGHSFYFRNSADSVKLMKHNIAFHTFGNGFSMYAGGGQQHNMHIVENIVFNSGILKRDRTLNGNIIVGGYNPSSNIVIKGNCTYLNSDRESKAQVRVGYGAVNNDCIVTDNYIGGGYGYMLGMYIEKWKKPTFMNNIIAGHDSENRCVIKVVTSDIDTSLYKWDNNTYIGYALNGNFPPGGGLDSDRGRYSLARWQETYGIDANSSYIQGSPTSNYIKVFPNEYEDRRGHIVVYNWLNFSHVNVNISSVIKFGQRYFIYDVQNLFGPPILSGINTGRKVSLPMNLTAVTPQPGDGPVAPEHSSAEFGVFLISGRRLHN